MPVRAVLRWRDIIERFGGKLGEENLRRLNECRTHYGAEERKSSLYGDFLGLPFYPSSDSD